MQQGADVFFLLMGAILVFAMHGGFAFLETGTVRHKNQVNALVKIIVDFSVSAIAYFLIGYTIAYGVNFFASAAAIAGGAAGFEPQGYTLVRLFFLATFAAAVPAIVSGGIAERAKFAPQAMATAAAGRVLLSAARRRVLERQLRAAGRPSSRTCSARRSRISPAPSSCMRSAAGWRSAPCSCWARGSGATGMRTPARRRPPRSRGWRSAHGSCASAGSGSTS